MSCEVMFEWFVLYIAVIVKICPYYNVCIVFDTPYEETLILTLMRCSVGQSRNIFTELRWYEPVHFEFIPFLLMLLTDKIFNNFLKIHIIPALYSQTQTSKFIVIDQYYIISGYAILQSTFIRTTSSNMAHFCVRYGSNNDFICFSFRKIQVHFK